MRKSIRLGLASSVALLAAAAQSAPTPNLVLACPDDSALGQPGLDSCSGYTYEIPTNQRIVSTGSFSSHYWIRASDLGGPNTVLVCMLPVEPGTYSSCRDAAGVRRTAFVPKDTVLPGGVVTVSKVGGDYADPVTAANNAFSGDTWCVAPQWPLQPCVIAIDEGVFILRGTLSILDGLAVSGNGKGATMLIADDNVETAVVAVGNVRISDLTIVNSKPGGAKTVGVEAYVLTSTAALTQLHDVAIHVSGAATNVGILKRESLEILDSEITAVGQNATGISAALGASLPANVTLERSYVSAARGLPSPTLEIPPIALDEPLEQAGGARIIRLFDSHLFGDINFVYNDTPQMEESLLEVIQTEIVGDVRASNRRGRVVITGSSIKGNFSDYGNRVITQNQVLFSDTYLEGDVHLRTLDAVLDTVGIHGLLLIAGQKGSVRSSYIYSEHAAGAMLIEANVVRMEQTFVQGAPFAVGVTLLRRFEAFSSVLVGTVAGHPTAVLSCTDTYGADYDLLDAACQPPQP